MNSVSFSIEDFEQHDKVVLECFSKLWHHSVDFMFIMAVEPNGEFSLYDNNPASKRVMGLDEHAVTHRINIRETWSDEIVEGLYETYRNAISHGHPISYEQYATLSDHPIFVDTLLVPIFDEEGNPQFVCGVSRDISKIKEAEQIAVEANIKLKQYTEALESINSDLDEKVKARTLELERATKEVEEVYKAKSAFLSRMSHEIRTPINAIVGLASMLSKTNLTSVQQSYLDKILQAGQLLTGVVNDTLDLSKLEAGKLEVEHVTFSPEQVMQQAMNIVAMKAYEKKLDIAVVISANLPEIVIGDPLRIKQITINLLSNAIKFTEEGAIALEVSYDEQQATLVWHVKDTGKGISERHIGKLFQSFNQLEASTSRHYGGTGLGLVISKQLCELMGGSISAESILGEGSCFSVRLPVAQQNHTRSTSRHCDMQGKILLLDSHPASRLAIAEMLTDIGYEVEWCDDLTSGLAKALGSEPYNKVLIDVEIIKQEGLESLPRELVSHYPPSNLILMRTFADELLDFGQALQTPVMLEKPVFRSPLLHVLNTNQCHHPDQTYKVEAQASKVLPNWSGYSILVVDDNEINQQVARGYLEQTGVSITTAMSGLQAIEIIDKKHFDLVLMDINMPHLDGWQATTMIRQHYSGSELPIVALTAFSGEEVFETCLRVGMSAHIGKPIVESQLMETLGKFLTAKSSAVTSIRPVPVVVDSGWSERLNPLFESELLNVPLALQRLQSRHDLLVDVLDTFYRRYCDSALVSDPFEISDSEFFSECHSLKSSAAYIGAETLLTLCRKVELDNSTPELREQVHSTLTSVLQLLETTLRKNEPVFSQDTINDADLITVLLEQLSKSNFSAAQTISKIRQLPWCKKGDQQQLDKIDALLDEVEFEEAYSMVKTLFADKGIS